MRALLAFALGAVGLGILPQAREARVTLEASPVVWIEPGRFVMGASDGEIAYGVGLCARSRPVPIRSLVPETDGACSPRRFIQESPRRWVWTPAYGLDRTEVTHRQWRACVIAGRCAPSRIPDEDARLAAADMPVTGITHPEAMAFCAWRGGRLPTEAEWERAARGTARHRFPWGRHYNSRLANHGRSPRGPDAEDGWALASPVGSFPDGASSYGVLDMAGNAWEWTASAPTDDDVGLGADPDVYRVVRGGSWAHPPELMRVTHRVWLPTSESRSDLGFRCAYDPPVAP